MCRPHPGGEPIHAVRRYSQGRRPSWSKAAPASAGEPLVDAFVEALSELGAQVETGRFGAMMDVEMVNHGPMTILLDLDE